MRAARRSAAERPPSRVSAGGTQWCWRNRSSAFDIVNDKTFCIRLEIAGWVEGHTVEQSFLVVVRSAVGIADLLHRFLIEVRTHDLFGDALVIRRPADHAPAAELGQPPLRELRLRIIAVALAVNHVVIVLF